LSSHKQEVAGAVIQAGDYQANPFYGVPIHLSYVAKDHRTKSSPLRFRASQAGRIEIYSLERRLPKFARRGEVMPLSVFFGIAARFGRPRLG
jgi:hypothetical protein